MGVCQKNASHTPDPTVTFGRDMVWPWSFVQLVFDQYQIELHTKDFAVALNSIDDVIKIKGQKWQKM